MAAALATVMGDAAWADTGSTTDFAALRSSWVDQLTGRTVIVASDKDFQAALTNLDKAVAASQSKLDTAADRTDIFTDLPFYPAPSTKTAPSLTNTYARLAQMATAWATPGATGYQDTTLLQQVLAGLQDGNTLLYNAKQGEFGNWYAWEIGASKPLADTMVIVYAHLSSDQINAYTATIDHFVADPTKQYPPGDPSRPQIVSVGANRTDLCQAVIINSLVEENVTRLQSAVSDLSDVWTYVTSDNGFYRDGSFVQHHTIPYTGTYGVILLDGLAKLFALLSGSALAIDGSGTKALFDTVENSFAPVVYNAQMMDCVRGRAVSRDTENSHDDAYAAIEAILTLAPAVDAKLAATWKSICAGWLARDTYGNILDGASLPRTALVKALQKERVRPAREPRGHTLFASMDRSIHRGHNFAFAVSMSSSRISWYESSNGENLKGAQEGSGMTYLYNDDNGQFDDDFWPTVNLSRLPGITVDTAPLPDKVEGGSKTPQGGVWTGGSVLNHTAAVGQNLIGPGTTGVKAFKSWFFDGDIVVALGAGIESSSGATVETVVENRNLHASGTNTITVDGRTVARSAGSTATTHHARWAHLDKVAGYLILDHSTLSVLRDQRTGSWSVNSVKGSTTPITRNYATLLFDHGANPSNASYAYAVLPGASERETAQRAHRPGFRVLHNDANAQAVQFDDGTVAINFWAAATIGEITATAPMSIVYRRDRGVLKIAVADPTQTAASVNFILAHGGWHRVSGASSTTRHHGALSVTVATAGKAGASLLLTAHH